MRMRMNNEDEVSRLARERKEARELEARGIVPSKEIANEETPIAESKVENTRTILKPVPPVPKGLPGKKPIKKKK